MQLSGMIFPPLSRCILRPFAPLGKGTAAVHQALLAADPHGRYFQTHIRDRHRFRKG